MSRLAFASVSLCAIGVLLSGCITTAVQGYADRDLPARPIQHMAAYVVAPTALASSFQSSIAEEKSGVGEQDPIVRQTVLEGSSILAPGKPLTLGSLDIPGSTRRLEVEVVLEAVR